MSLANYRLRRKTVLCLALAVSSLWFYTIYFSRFNRLPRLDENVSSPVEPSPVEIVNPTPPAVYGSFPRPKYELGVVKPPGSNYTRTLVVARTKDEDVSWVANDLGDDPSLETAIYTVDDPDADFTVPKNKGHEVMVYLTYIIDHYEQLRDVTMFMHAHLISWHNNDILDWNAAQMVSRLSSPRVIREGFVNMRCHREPGCPDHIHTTIEDDSYNKPEVEVFPQSWREIFPTIPVPPVLSQPCCGQYALSRDRLRAVPLEQYIFFREWLLNTPLEDRLSGRVWEYVWQYVWAGVEEYCPEEHVCYCDGYGICFGSGQEYAAYISKRKEVQKLQEQLGTSDSNEEGSLDEDGREQVQQRINELTEELDAAKQAAIERGKDPRNRAAEAGRVWHEGDGF